MEEEECVQQNVQYDVHHILKLESSNLLQIIQWSTLLTVIYAAALKMFLAQGNWEGLRGNLKVNTVVKYDSPG
jgi:hypothetical protein